MTDTEVFMIDSVLVRHNVSLRLKITVKTLVSLAIVALAVLLPQLVHLAAGAQGGMQWLPMYLPVLLGGCLLRPNDVLLLFVRCPLKYDCAETVLHQGRLKRRREIPNPWQHAKSLK